MLFLKRSPMVFLRLDNQQARSLMWIIRNSLEDLGEWFEKHRPSDYGKGWEERALDIAGDVDRVANLLEDELSNISGSEQALEDARELYQTILKKCREDEVREKTQVTDERKLG
jgi:inhibitor of KinA sporulation pathway (predicted exonuclease)